MNFFALQKTPPSPRTDVFFARAPPWRVSCVTGYVKHCLQEGTLLARRRPWRLSYLTGKTSVPGGGEFTVGLTKTGRMTLFKSYFFWIKWIQKLHSNPKNRFFFSQRGPQEHHSKIWKWSHIPQLETPYIKFGTVLFLLLTCFCAVGHLLEDIHYKSL